jgi:isoleucyl-tRNA synthetase
MEGIAREFVNRIQNVRKDQNLLLTDKILVKVAENEQLKSPITKFYDYICAEILADSLEFLPEILDGTCIQVNDNQLNVIVIKKGNQHGN